MISHLAGVIVVALGSPVPSLDVALALARVGDTILIQPGTYHEAATVRIDRSVVIIGRSQPVLEGDGNHTLLRISAPDVVLEGLVLVNVRPSSTDDRAAILLDGATRCVIRRNVVRRAFFGIYGSKASNCRIEGNTVQGAGRTEQQSGNAIHLWSSSGMQVVGNVVSGHRDGIYLEFVRSSELADNVSRGNARYGLHFMFSDSCTYRRNTFTENGAGVAVMYTKNVLMAGNRFLKNQGQAAYGLLLKDITDSELRDNEFAANTIGLYLEGVSRLHASANRFLANGWAVRVLANSIDNTFEGNSFIGNTFDVTTNSRSAPTTFRRNYWDHYRGFDLDRNGVGDVGYRPVRLFSLIVAESEPALILLRSPFVDLLDAAERVLPILTPETLVDREPLMAAPSPR
jgi:nitrous oxidase accessory protein